MTFFQFGNSWLCFIEFGNICDLPWPRHLYYSPSKYTSHYQWELEYYYFYVNVDILFQENLHHRMSFWGSYLQPAWINYKLCFYGKILIKLWSVTRRKSRILGRLHFYLDFKILAFRRLCYSLQCHSPHWMDSVSLVHLKAEHECSTEFSLFQMDI